jgi:hypothetical protein
MATAKALARACRGWPKLFEIKILPVTCCSPKITLKIPANVMIPIIRGEGGVPPLSHRNPNSAHLLRHWFLAFEKIFLGQKSTAGNARRGDVEATYQCAGCGELNTTTVDESTGRQQSYVEDCQVCCKANVLRVQYDTRREDFFITAELE